MNRRIPFVAGAAGAGLLAAAFLQAAVAAADNGDAADISSNAFTIDGTTFDPGSDGFAGIDSLFTNAPLLDIGTNSPLGLIPGTQDLTVYDSDDSELGTVTTNVNDSNILGIESAQFTINNVDPADGVDADDLPADGTVYSVTNIGMGFQNVYEAVPNEDGDAAASIHDTLVTPFGNFDMSTDFDAIGQVDPDGAFDGLNTSGSDSDGLGGLLGGLGSSGGADGAGGAGGDTGSASAAAAESDDLPGSDGAVAINGLTFDPGSDGFTDLPPLFSVAPLMEIGGAALGGEPLYPESGIEVYDGTGSDATDLGSVDAGVNSSNIVGIDSTQITITGSDPADGLSDSQAADLPDDGTVYSVINIGSGFGNVYEADPNDDGSAASSISDTLVTPFGNFDVPTDFDAVAALDPGAPLDGLNTSSSDSSGGLLGGLLGGLGGDDNGASGGDGSEDAPGGAAADDPSGGGGADLSDHAFTIGDYSFDPGSDGFDSLDPLFGIAPLMEIGGGNLSGANIATQNGIEVYDSSGSELGSVDAGVNTSNILGIDTTQLTISGVDPAEGVDADQLPADGTVYSVSDLGMGIENVYEAVPNEDGDAAASIHDTLVTPFGNFDLSTMFDAVALLDPGEATDGLDTDSSGGGGLFGGLLDGLGGLLGGSGDGGAADVSASDITSALDAGDISFDEAEFSESDLASALAGSDLDFGSDISGSDVTEALSGGDISLDDSGISAGDIASALNDNLDVDSGGSGDGFFDSLGGLFDGGDGADGSFDLFDPSSWLG